jgi:hypothetical protein
MEKRNTSIFGNENETFAYFTEAMKRSVNHENDEAFVRSDQELLN